MTTLPRDRVTRCLRGRAIPPSLEILWRRHLARDRVVKSTLRIVRLLEDLSPLDAGYGEKIARESKDIAANVKAHRTVFEQLGFFAEITNSAFLAFWLGDKTEEPPVVKLDSEGQYSWRGKNLAEALFRIAEEIDEGDVAAEWLKKNGIELGDVGALGTTTQFLPSIGKLHEGIYYANRGEPRPKPELAAKPADPSDPATWLLRPGSEVKAVLEKSGPIKKQCTWCNGDGLVTQIVVPKGIAVLGAKVGDPRKDVEKKVGKPAKKGDGWFRIDRDGRGYHFEFDKKGLSRITLMLP